MSSTPFQRDPGPPIPDEAAPEVQRAARRRRLADRANRLRRAGYYDDEEVRMMAGWVSQGTYTLLEVERLVFQAEEDYRSHFTERPMVDRNKDGRTQ